MRPTRDFDDTSPLEGTALARGQLFRVVTLFAGVLGLALASATWSAQAERLRCLASLDRGLTLAQADVICGRPQ